MTLAERVVLMHQGGWDDITLVAGPVAIIAVLIIAARRQVPVDDDDHDDGDP